MSLRQAAEEERALLRRYGLEPDPRADEILELELADRLADQASLPPGDPGARALARQRLRGGRAAHERREVSRPPLPPVRASESSTAVRTAPAQTDPGPCERCSTKKRPSSSRSTTTAKAPCRVKRANGEPPDGRHPDEGAISKRAGPVPLRGDEERLFSEQRQRLVSILRLETGAPIALVEDGVSHAFEQLCRHQPKRDRVVGWLRVVARREVFRLLRNLRREPLAEDIRRRSIEGVRGEPVSIAKQVGDPRTVELEVEAREALRLLPSLGRNQRETLTLAAAGHSYREIQAIRGVSYTNVNRHMTEGRATARRLRDAA